MLHTRLAGITAPGFDPAKPIVCPVDAATFLEPFCPNGSFDWDEGDVCLLDLVECMISEGDTTLAVHRVSDIAELDQFTAHLARHGLGLAVRYGSERGSAALSVAGREAAVTYEEESGEFLEVVRLLNTLTVPTLEYRQFRRSLQDNEEFAVLSCQAWRRLDRRFPQLTQGLFVRLDPT